MKKCLIVGCLLFSYNAFSLVSWGSPYVFPHDNNGSCDGGEYVEVGFNSNFETNNDFVEIFKSLDPSFSWATRVGNRINGCGTCGSRIYAVFDYGPFAPNQVWFYKAVATSQDNLFGFTLTEHNLGSYTTNVPTIANWINQVSSTVTLSSSPNTESSYTWAKEYRLGQGITISLSPTEISKIYIEDNNNKINFALNLSFSMVSIAVNIDNSSYVNLFSGSPVSNYIWNNSANYFIGLGEHSLKVRFTDSGGIVYYREYRVFVVPISNDLFYDNYCNTMRVWKSPGGGNKIPLILSEGFDAYNIKPEQYYREAGKDLINCLLTKGFDIYVINYKYNSQDIRNNAAVFSSAIRYVSSINNNQPIIAAGMSMGGIINRYACAKAENDGTPLPISKFVTIDAPHQGAVIDSKVQDYFKSIASTQFDRQFADNDAAKELLIYNTFEPSANSHNVFFNELNSLNGNGYPHLVPTVGVSFSTTAGNPYWGQWLRIDINEGPLAGTFKHFDISDDAELSAAGSYLPQFVRDPVYSLNDWGWIVYAGINYGGMNPAGSPLLWNTPYATITETAHPSFILHNSSLDIVNGISKFNVTIQPNTTGFHDVIPPDIIEPLINALLNKNLYLQNKTITDTKNYIASSKIEAGNNVTSTLPAGDFIVANGSNVMMTAGNQIKLSVGFIAHAGSNFNAKIDSVRCDGIQSTQFRNSISNEDNNDNYTHNQENNSTPLYSVNKISETIVSEETILKSQRNSINIIPNPSNGKFKISITKNEKAIGIKELKVYDLMGKVIWQTASSTNSVFEADIADVASGIYYVRSVNEDGDIDVQKLIKQ